MDFLSVIVLATVVELGIGILLAVSWRDTFSRVIVIVLLLLGMVIVLDVVAISTDFQDADGIFDCSPYCSRSQNIISWSLTGVALLLAVLPMTVVLRQLFRGKAD